MSVYCTDVGVVTLSRHFGPELSRVSYWVRDGSHASCKLIGIVSRIPPWGVKWEIVGDNLKRTFSTRRAAIEALQKAAA